MKRSILLLFILVVFCLGISYGTTFYVDASKGSDSNSGISQTKAWKTIDKVNMAGLSPGDFVLFKRGGTFRGFLTPESGSSSGYITYGAYGSGKKPKILGSVSRNLTSDWTNVGTNLWQASNINIDTSGIDVGNIIFNNEESCGIKVKTVSDLNAQGKFYSDNNKKRVIMYSVGNPAIYYSTLELALGRNLISPRNKCYIICENLDLRYGGNHGVGGGDTHHMIIRNMDFSYIGGSYLRGFRSGTVRYGNGVEFYNGAYANIIERCTFSQIYDVAMTCQGNKTGYQVYDIYFRNNIVSKCEQSFEFWVRGVGASARNIYFVNNTCIDAGMGWSHSQRPDKNGTHLLFYGSDPNSSFSNIVIRNNIFMNAANSGIYESRAPLPDLDISKITINNNDWYVSGMLRVPPAMYDWNYYRTNTRQDSNSVTSNPLLTSTNSIPSNSPCVDTGVTLSYVTGDFIGTSRPRGNACDMGAFEFISNSKKRRGINESGSVRTQDQKIDFTSQWDTIRVLKNPYKGWYHHLLDNGISLYPVKDDSLFASFPGMDHIYLRLAWSYLEPKEGEFDWSYIDRVVEKYVPKGYKISFRITCSETGIYPNSVGEQVDGVQYATPCWVERAGAKGTIVDRGNGKTKSWVPKWDDPVFLLKLDQFHKAFATRYDGKPWVSYVDIGSIGDWGEGLTAFSTKIPPTVSEGKANVDVFLKNYKKSQLVVNDELLFWGKPDADAKTLYNYVTGKGITIRDDSPLVGWWVPRILKTWTVLHPEFFDQLYLTKPIILETQHYGAVKRDGNWLGKNGETIIPELKVSGADILRGATKIMHATYIGFHGYAEEWLADNPDLTRELANLCGYWFFPVNATVPGKMTKGENSLAIEWLNKGVAPAYNVFSLVLRFEAQNPENSFELVVDDSGNKNWLPDKIKVEKYMFAIPSKTPKGQYKLMFKLVDQSNERKQEIQLGLKEKSIGSQGFIFLGKVSV